MVKQKEIKKRLYKRRFLNQKEGIALLVTECEYVVNKAGWPHFNASVMIGDCSRQVTLDFCLYTDGADDGTLKARLQKLDTLITDLYGLREKLAEWGPEYIAKETERKAKHKADKAAGVTPKSVLEEFDLDDLDC